MLSTKPLLLCARPRVKYFHGSPHLNLRTALQSDRNYLHFMDGETEARAQVLYLSKGAQEHEHK